MKTKNNRSILIFTFFICGIGSSAFGNQTLASCLGQPPSIEKKYLLCLRDSTRAREIRRNFDELLKKRRECKDCAETFPGESNFASLYKQKFLMLDMDHNPFGGYSAHIIFDEGRERLYKVWLYPGDENKFQLREFEPVAPSKKTVRIMTTLFNSTLFSDYSL